MAIIGKYKLNNQLIRWKWKGKLIKYKIRLNRNKQ